jgi:hypothetical protein
MRNVWIGGIAALALGWTAGVAAQTTPPPSTSSGQAAQTVKITGCLKPADAMGGATGTSGSTAPGTSSTAGGSDRFMLTNASMGSGTSAQTGTSGTAGTTAGTPAGTASTSRPAASGSSYTLDGNASELRPHLNHQVEITGRLEASANRSGAAAGTTAGGTSSTASTGASTATGAGAAQNLRVESVRMIAATCPAP